MEKYNIPIKDWIIEDRPREKLMEKGLQALTETELLATLIATGTRKLSAIDLARNLILHFGGLNQLARASVREMMAVKGIGKAKATCIASAFELSRRRTEVNQTEIKISSSAHAANYISPKLSDLHYEACYVLFLNRSNVVIGEETLFIGGVSATVIDPKVVFNKALAYLSSALIISHNHPSGSLNPSVQDDNITRKLVQAGKMLEIKVLDHLIIGGKGYYSYADEGRLDL